MATIAFNFVGGAALEVLEYDSEDDITVALEDDAGVEEGGDVSPSADFPTVHEVDEDDDGSAPATSPTGEGRSHRRLPEDVDMDGEQEVSAELAQEFTARLQQSGYRPTSGGGSGSGSGVHDLRDLTALAGGVLGVAAQQAASCDSEDDVAVGRHSSFQGSEAAAVDEAARHPGKSEDVAPAEVAAATRVQAAYRGYATRTALSQERARPEVAAMQPRA